MTLQNTTCFISVGSHSQCISLHDCQCIENFWCHQSCNITSSSSKQLRCIESILKKHLRFYITIKYQQPNIYKVKLSLWCVQQFKHNRAKEAYAKFHTCYPHILKVKLKHGSYNFGIIQTLISDYTPHSEILVHKILLQQSRYSMQTQFYSKF